MSIKKKLYISNFILLLLPLFLVVAFNTVFINIFKLPEIVLILFSIALLTVVFVNILLTVYITRSIAERIDIITYATKEIKEGNLDYVVNYEIKDEFYEMLQEFDQMRLALKSSIEEVQMFDQEKRQLTNSIVHDLKTPIATILGCSQGLLDNVANTEEKRNIYIKNIYDKTKHMDSLVDNLLLISKLENKIMTLDIEDVNIEKYIKQIYEELKIDFLEKNIILNLETNCNKDTYISIDKIQMKRVFQNIIENSIKYKKNDPLKIDFFVRENKENIIIKISDNGIGIKEGEENKIFERFFRSEKARTFNGGSGLGLTTTKFIVENLSGRVWSRRNKVEGLSIYMSFTKKECNIEKNTNY